MVHHDCLQLKATCSWKRMLTTRKGCLQLEKAAYGWTRLLKAGQDCLRLAWDALACTGYLRPVQGSHGPPRPLKAHPVCLQSVMATYSRSRLITARPECLRPIQTTYSPSRPLTAHPDRLMTCPDRLWPVQTACSLSSQARSVPSPYESYIGTKTTCIGTQATMVVLVSGGIYTILHHLSSRLACYCSIIVTIRSMSTIHKYMVH